MSYTLHYSYVPKEGTKYNEGFTKRGILPSNGYVSYDVKYTKITYLQIDREGHREATYWLSCLTLQ
jgi:hypothetical protein